MRNHVFKSSIHFDVGGHLGNAKKQLLCCVCGSVSRAVASYTRGLWFESRHRRILYRTFIYCQLYCKEKTKIKREKTPAKSQHD